MKVLIVYCHPSDDSFTKHMCDAFIKGIEDSGNEYILSDLYKMDFNPAMSEQEYLRDAYYRNTSDVAGDVLAEQEKINSADAIAFIYPVFWTEAPAKLVGWFDRVWSYGFAYGEKTMKELDKAIILCSAGNPIERLEQFGLLDSMKKVMLGDRLFGRAREMEFIVFDNTSRENELREKNWDINLRKAYEKGKSLFSPADKTKKAIRLETERLILRDFTDSDFEAYYKLKTDDQTMYYLQDIKLKSIDAAKADFTDVLDDMKRTDRKYYFFHMELKDSHEQVGSIGYTVTDETPAGKMVHLGYFTYPAFWGNGYTTEALKKVLEYAFTAGNVYRVTTGCLADNIGSERVMQKNGMIKEAEHVDYEWHDGKMKTRLEYRLLKNEWAEWNGYDIEKIPQRQKMNLSDCYLEEDLFPKIFADYEERSYGILFYKEDNKDSFDSNHAVIYKDRTEDLQGVLSDIVHFYSSKGIRPIIYQSMLDDNWFGEIKEYLAAAGFRSWVEDQEYMLPAAENLITPNPKVEVRKVTKWRDELEKVFREAEEPWEIEVARKTLEYPKAWMFAAYLEDKPVGLLYGHISERACRVDYLLVARKYRKTGVGRALFYQYMEWCKENGIHNIYIWPDGDTPKRIYEEGGFRIAETRKAGRAVFDAD